MISSTESRPKSGARAMLMATAIGACAAAIVTPVAGALAAEARLTAQGPIDVRIGASPGFTRVEFRSATGQRPRLSRSGDRIVLRLPAGAESALARLRVDPPKGVAGIDTRADRRGLEVTITLERGATASTGEADGALYLNFYPSKPDAAAAKGHGRPDPTPASGVVRVAETADGAEARLSFGFAAPVGSAVFRRGGAVYVVFDTRAKLDLGTRQERAPGAIGHVRWSAGPDYTVVRIETPEAVSLSAATEGANWTLTLGGAPAPPAEAVKLARDDQAGPPALTAGLSGATRVIWLTDPVIGDRLAVVTAIGAAKPVDHERTFVDAVIPATVHGLAVEATAPDLDVALAGDLVRITRPHGLTLSPAGSLAGAAPTAPLALPQPAAMPGLVDFARWSDTGGVGFVARYRQLQDLAMAEGAKGQGAPVTARMAFARFLVGSELGYEAIGLIDLIARQNPAMLNDPELRGLRGVARVMTRRYKEAEADFSAPGVSTDPASALWRGYLEARLGDWAAARRSFAAGARAVDSFPPAWRARFATAHATAAMEQNDRAAAQSLIAYALALPAPPADQLAALLVKARLFDTDGQTDRALAVYDAISRATTVSLATPALMHATRIRYEKGMIQPSEAVTTLNSLRFRWRGDATELEVIRSLGEIYLGLGRYREALETLRSAGKRLPDSPAALRLQAELGDAFRRLFLQGGADGLEPIQALALFYDFRELTPVGADGDEMVRRLSRRLIDVDLLSQAAELLKYQVDNRLDGVAKAQVATNLAALYLMDRKPELALQAIWGSRTTLLPNALNAQRRGLEARALMDLTKYDNALEILGKDASPEAEDVRAEIFWRRQNWADAGRAYERRLGDRYKTPATPLTGEEETRLIRAGIAYSLAADGKSLQQLAGRFAPMVEHARAPEALRIALAGLDGAQISPSDFARATAQADTFAGWVAGMKQRFRDAVATSTQAAANARSSAAG